MITGKTDQEIMGEAAKEIRRLRSINAQLLAALKLTQFGFNHRRCNVCGGWNIGPNGEIGMVHTKKCPVGLAIKAAEEKP